MSLPAARFKGLCTLSDQQVLPLRPRMRKEGRKAITEVQTLLGDYGREARVDGRCQGCAHEGQQRQG